MLSQGLLIGIDWVWVTKDFFRNFLLKSINFYRKILQKRSISTNRLLILANNAFFGIKSLIFHKTLHSLTFELLQVSNLPEKLKSK